MKTSLVTSLVAMSIVMLACAGPRTELVPDLVPEPVLERAQPAPVLVDTSTEAATYPATAIELFNPPLPYPSEVKGFHLIAEFDVSALGIAKLTGMSRTPNAAYNLRLQSMLRSIRFRPGTASDGKPAHSTARLAFDF